MPMLIVARHNEKGKGVGKWRIYGDRTFMLVTVGLFSVKPDGVDESLSKALQTVGAHFGTT